MRHLLSGLLTVDHHCDRRFNRIWDLVGMNELIVSFARVGNDARLLPMTPEDSIAIPFTSLGCSRIWMKLFLICSFVTAHLWRFFIRLHLPRFSMERKVKLVSERDNLLEFVSEIGSSLDEPARGPLSPFRPRASETRKTKVCLLAHLASSIRERAITAASSYGGDLSFAFVAGTLDNLHIIHDEWEYDDIDG